MTLSGHACVIVHVLICFFIGSYACLAAERVLRKSLKGGFPLCEQKEDLLRTLDDAVLQDARSTLYSGACFPLRDRGRGLRFSLVEEHGDFIKIRIDENPIPQDRNVFWTFRLAAFDETPERFLSFVQSALKKGKVSTETFLNPESGQIEFCSTVTTAQNRSPASTASCEKAVRSKGYIRADEYKLRFLKQ